MKDKFAEFTSKVRCTTKVAKAVWKGQRVQSMGTRQDRSYEITINR